MPQPQKCENPDCQRAVLKEDALFVMGYHILVCSDFCELKMLRRLSTCNKEKERETK